VIPVPASPNIGVFPDRDCALISYAEYSEGASADWLDVYRLSDWSLRGRLRMDCRAHFNFSPKWSTFIPAPDETLIYLYKSLALGHHLSADFICGLDLSTISFTEWDFQVPECVAGWSNSGGRAHAQMLFVSDGLEVGAMPTSDLEQKVGFWLGPELGMGPTVSLGFRPRAHSDLGHARAILSAQKRPLTVVVCTDGTAHLIDPAEFRYLESQRIEFADGQAMPVFSAQIDPKGDFLWVGTASAELRCQCLAERVVVHDLNRGERKNEIVLGKPLAHLALTQDGEYLCGLSPESNALWALNAQTGQTEGVQRFDGFPQFVIAV